MPVEWSAGWLLERMMELEQLPESWANQPIGFGLDDPDWDPVFDPIIGAAGALAEPPIGEEVGE